MLQISKNGIFWRFYSYIMERMSIIEGIRNAEMNLQIGILLCQYNIAFLQWMNLCVIDNNQWWNQQEEKVKTIFLWLHLSSEEEKAMAPHSSTLAWKIPWMEEPGRLQSMGSLGVGHDWATSLSLFTFMHWRRKWQPTPVFLPGDSQGQKSLVGCRLWGHTELDTTEAT